MDNTENMRLWELVHDTPPQYTKGFKKSGGFGGTAIDPTYLVMRATELWGPIGGEWGYEIVDEAYIEGEPFIFTLADGNPQIVGHETIHKIRLRLTYPIQSEAGVTTSIGHVEQFGQTTFVGRDKNGYFTDEEHAKKSLTDALSKCLSLLGFGADVRIGKFEDSSYAQLREEAEAEAERKVGAITSGQLADIEQLLKQGKKEWAKLAMVCSNILGREIKEMIDLTEPEAVRVLAFLQGKVAKVAS